MPAVPAAERIEMGTTKEKILVADGEEHIVALLETYLGREGYRVASASDGDSTMAKFRQESPDLLVLDMGLPGKGGLEVLREIRRESEVPVIMFAAYESEDTQRERGFELGVEEFVTKPFRPRDLVSRVKTVLLRSKIERSKKMN
jgi:DNA-binding response OmpR family regulator